MDALLGQNVPDPTDFPADSSAPGLRCLDSSLRCTICGELFDAPVTLPCGHCFCSFCVRTAMSEKQECPGCRKVANEGHLRPNPVIEEVVAAWKTSRPYILQLVKEGERQESSGYQTSLLLTPHGKKRKRSVGLSTTESSSLAGSSTSAPSSPSKPSKRNQRKNLDSIFETTTIPTSDADEDELHSGTSFDPKPDNVVNCPLCNKAMKYKSINPHIDRGCKDPLIESGPSKKSEWMRIMGQSKGKQREIADSADSFPLPKASYDTLKDKKLKEMLIEHGLPTTGDRNALVKRHQQWVMVYNANLDRSSSNRRTKQELKRGLKQWEDEKAKQKSNVVDDENTHQKRHKEEFAQLIEAARKNRAPTLTKPRSSLSGHIDDTAIPPSHGAQKGQPLPVRCRSSCGDDIVVLDSEEDGLYL